MQPILLGPPALVAAELVGWRDLHARTWRRVWCNGLYIAFHVIAQSEAPSAFWAAQEQAILSRRLIVVCRLPLAKEGG